MLNSSRQATMPARRRASIRCTVPSRPKNPIGYFGRWLDQYNLQFHDAALIDDRADNCEAFTTQGG